MNIPDKIKTFFDNKPLYKEFTSIKIPQLNNKHELGYWLTTESHFPYFPLALKNVPYSEMLAEAKAIDHLFQDHRIPKNSDGSYESYGWASVCIHGQEWNLTENYTAYEEFKNLKQEEVVYKWCEEITTKCPVTTKFFKEVFPAESYMRVRFMKLKKGGYINPHKDMEKKLLYPVNISLNNPNGCRFKITEEYDIPFSDSGSAFTIDTSNLHSVWNNSEEDRYHIIVHGRYGVRYAELLEQSVNEVFKTYRYLL